MGSFLRRTISGIFVQHPGAIGKPGLAGRLYRVRIGSALLLLLPALFLAGWYVQQAVVSHLRYNLAAGEEQPLTLEVFHLHLYDALTSDLRRLTLPAPGKDDLPTYAIHIGNGELSELASNLPPGDGKSNYVPGYIKKGNQVLPMKARYRGRKHWHWNYAQKSWKVRITEGNFLDGRQTLAFINTPDALPFDEQLVLDIAREHDLLTPEYFPFRLLLNNVYMGVYFYSAQADESVVRQAKRMPGSIYSGNEAPVDPRSGISTLWRSSATWKKVGATNKRSLDDFGELQELLEFVNSAAQVEFAEYARQHLSLERFAMMDALDVVFGSNQHDFARNHKLYFDPYKGQFEPIAWNFRGWRHRTVFNRTENPLLLRLKEVPGYLTLRNKKVYQLLDGACSPEELKKRGEKLLADLKAAQTQDPYWDAFHLMPKVSRYFRQMVRPMDRQLQATVFANRMRVHGQRVAFLKRALEGARAEAVLQARPEPGHYMLGLTVHGVSGFKLERVVPHWQTGCTGSLTVLPDCAGCDTEHALEFHPGVRQVARTPHRERGNVRTAPEPRLYPLKVESGKCPLQSLDVHLTNLVTGQSAVAPAPLGSAMAPAQPVDPAQEAEALAKGPDCLDMTYTAQAGQRSLHPWCFPVTPHTVVTLGPGEVKIKKTRIYGPHEGVIIQPGTTLRLSKKASLIFRGPLFARGTADQPIRFLPKKKKWGGLALQGPGTAGSVLEHVIIQRGSIPTSGRITYPGMLNLHDTSNIQLSYVELRDNRKGDDALHAAYVKGLVLDHVVVRDAAIDAIDLEFCKAVLTNVEIYNPGDECLDLMGTKVSVEDSVFSGAGAKALSAGEETRARLTRVLLTDSDVGVLSKNASRVRLHDSLLYRNRLAVHVIVESQRYSGQSRVKTGNSFVKHCGEELLLEEGRFKKMPHLPQLEPSGLPELRESLGLGQWSELAGWLEQRAGESR